MRAAPPYSPPHFRNVVSCSALSALSIEQLFICSFAVSQEKRKTTDEERPWSAKKPMDQTFLVPFRISIELPLVGCRSFDPEHRSIVQANRYGHIEMFVGDREKEREIEGPRRPAQAYHSGGRPTNEKKKKSGMGEKKRK